MCVDLLHRSVAEIAEKIICHDGAVEHSVILKSLK